MYQQKRSPFEAPNYDVFAPSRMSDERGVILGAPLDGAQSYVPWIGVTTIRELALKHADKTGLVERFELELATERADGLEELLAQANERIDELEAVQDRFAGLARDGYKVVKVQGRPPTKTPEKV